MRKILLVILMLAAGALVVSDANAVQPSRQDCYLRFTVDGAIARMRCGDLMTVRDGECWIHQEPENVWMRCQEAREG